MTPPHDGFTVHDEQSRPAARPGRSSGGPSQEPGRGSEPLTWPFGPFRLLWIATREWVGHWKSLAIVASFYVLSIGPLWLGNLLDPKAAAARVDFDWLGVLEPVAAHPWDQLLARLNSTLLAAPSIRPVFPPTALPPPQGFWTPGLLVAASDLAWIAGIAMLPFFIEAVAGFGGDVERVGRYRIATRVILARIGVSIASFATTYIAFRALPWALPGAFGGNIAVFEAVQHTIDSLSVPVVGLVFMWPFACGVLGLRLLEGLRWTWRVWRREWRWILAVLVVTLALRWASPLLLAGAKASGSLHWSLRLALRSVAAIYRFWLDATVCACWALLARYFGRSGAEDPRLA